jgi:RNAse (barnase) inhibitor barstar
MEKGKIKNTITRSFELQDYRIEGTELSGFWADLLSEEELVIDVNYRPENKKTFSQEDVKTLIQKICNKCESFESQLPKNIRCEVTFKNLGEKVYRTDQPDFELTPRELEEIQVSYRFYVEYYI